MTLPDICECAAGQNLHQRTATCALHGMHDRVPAGQRASNTAETKMELLLVQSPNGGNVQAIQGTEAAMQSALARLRAAHRARQSAHQKRLLAAERAVQLESQLRETAETGARAEIARSLALRRQLLAVQKVTVATQASRRAELGSIEGSTAERGAIEFLSARKARPSAAKLLARYTVTASMGLLLGTAVATMTPSASIFAHDQQRAAEHFVVLDAPGEALKLRLSTSVLARAAR